MTRLPLTARQHEAYDFIREHIRTRRASPTLAEIGLALSVRSTNAVHKLVAALEHKGYISRTPRISRGISLLNDVDPFAQNDSPLLLPVVGRAHSDRSLELRREPAGAVLVDPRFLGPADPGSCLIVVSADDGMQDIGIRKTDLLIVEETDWQQLLNGELTAVLVGERIIARWFDFSRNRFHLRPSTAGYREESFRLDAPGCHIIGRVLSVMRKL